MVVLGEECVTTHTSTLEIEYNVLSLIDFSPRYTRELRVVPTSESSASLPWVIPRCVSLLIFANQELK